MYGVPGAVGKKKEKEKKSTGEAWRQSTGALQRHFPVPPLSRNVVIAAVNDGIRSAD